MMAGETLEVERTSGTPSGWKAKLNARDIFPYIIIAMLLLVIAFLANFSLRMWGEPFDLKDAMQSHTKSMDYQHTNYINGVSELTYVMSVCLNQARQKECERLHISMPESLYRKMNNGQQP